MILQGLLCTCLLALFGLLEVDGFVENPDFQWPDNLVPYHLGDITEANKALFAKAKSEIEQKTCVQFIPWDGKKADYISLENQGRRVCSAPVGKQGGKQVVALGPGCAIKGVIIQKLLNVLGFENEEQRADRDKYITVNYDHIENGKGGEFAKFNGETGPKTKGFSGTYSPFSVMQSPLWHNAKLGQRSMALKPHIAEIVKKSGKTVGPFYGMSDDDKTRVIRQYPCSAAHTQRKQEVQQPVNEEQSVREPKKSYCEKDGVKIRINEQAVVGDFYYHCAGSIMTRQPILTAIGCAAKNKERVQFASNRPNMDSEGIYEKADGKFKCSLTYGPTNSQCPPKSVCKPTSTRLTCAWPLYSQKHHEISSEPFTKRASGDVLQRVCTEKGVRTNGCYWQDDVFPVNKPYDDTGVRYFCGEDGPYPIFCVGRNNSQHTWESSFEESQLEKKCHKTGIEVTGCFKKDLQTRVKLGEKFTESNGLIRQCLWRGVAKLGCQTARGKMVLFGESFTEDKMEKHCGDNGIEVRGCYGKNSMVRQLGEKWTETEFRLECRETGIETLGCVGKPQPTFGYIFKDDHNPQIERTCTSDRGNVVSGCFTASGKRAADVNKDFVDDDKVTKTCTPKGIKVKACGENKIGFVFEAGVPLMQMKCTPTGVEVLGCVGKYKPAKQIGETFDEDGIFEKQCTAEGIKLTKCIASNRARYSVGTTFNDGVAKKCTENGIELVGCKGEDGSNKGIGQEYLEANGVRRRCTQWGTEFIGCVTDQGEWAPNAEFDEGGLRKRCTEAGVQATGCVENGFHNFGEEFTSNRVRKTCLQSGIKSLKCVARDGSFHAVGSDWRDTFYEERAYKFEVEKYCNKTADGKVFQQAKQCYNYNSPFEDKCFIEYNADAFVLCNLDDEFTPLRVLKAHKDIEETRRFKAEKKYKECKLNLEDA